MAIGDSDPRNALVVDRNSRRPTAGDVLNPRAVDVFPDRRIGIRATTDDPNGWNETDVPGLDPHTDILGTASARHFLPSSRQRVVVRARPDAAIRRYDVRP